MFSEYCITSYIKQADVIVNLTSKEFDLTSGYLAKQIHEKAGPAVQNELNQVRYPWFIASVIHFNKGYESIFVRIILEI